MHLKSGLIFLLVIMLFIPTQGKNKIDSSLFGDIKARNIGPAVMSGRITCIDVVEKDKNTMYIGTAGGGVWKSKDGGITFESVFDKHTMSVGCITVDQKKPDIVWVGTGEINMRNSVSVGTGIYRTVDGGKTWKSMGLKDSERISTIIVDPNNSDIVYAAVAGHLWNSNVQRGLFKTVNGGKTWEKILYVNPDTGCIDLDMDPKNPNILYAAMWEFRRKPYFFTSGGKGSGLFKSNDSGKTWRKLSKGLPKGRLGRIVLDIFKSDPNMIYALVEAKDTYIYRSKNRGLTWEKRGTGFGVKARPFYLGGLKVDPKDPERVYNPSFLLSVSKNGGKSFESAMESFMGMTVHPDQHALWIDSDNPKHMILGTDGGVYVSYDRGGKFRHISNIPVSQFYHVSFDLLNPYNVYGGLQDNNSWYGPSRSITSGYILNRDWKAIGGGDGFYMYRDPVDKNSVYFSWQGGMLQRYNEKTGELASIRPLPSEKDPEYRFNWNAAVALSPNSKKRIYIGAQFLFVSETHGNRWKRISPDLTTNDKSKQQQKKSGGLTPDNTAAENYCTIVAVSESPVNEKVIWVGTDDGNLQITKNGGKNWENVVRNINGLPKGIWCPSVESSRFKEGRAYVVFDGHRSGNMVTYVYTTDDFGKSWKKISNENLEGYAHVIREDLKNENLLFLGTEFGLFVSFDRGNNWIHFKETLPKVAVRDVKIHPVTNDLILATHGRGIYIIDDITPLRSIDSKVLNSDVSILPARPSETSLVSGGVIMTGDTQYFGENPPEGATITYYLKKRHIFGELKLEVFNVKGKLIKTLPTGKRRGINRVYWSMRLKAPKAGKAPGLTGFVFGGPMVDPGTYKIKLSKNGKEYNSEIVLRPDSLSHHSPEERELRQKKIWEVYAMLEHMAYFSDTLKDIKNKLTEISKDKKIKKLIKRKVIEYIKRAKKIRNLMIDEKASIYSSQMLQGKLIEIYSSISSYGGAPTGSQIVFIKTLKKKLSEVEKKFGEFINSDIKSLNKLIGKAGIKAIRVESEEEFIKRNRD